jgi:hypothetical protein
LRRSYPIPIPRHRRALVHRVEDDPHGPGVLVYLCTGGCATMSAAGFLATCRVCEHAEVRSERVLAAVTA